VIPAYNEEARIAQTLRAIQDYLGRQRYRSEVIIVDDGSTDLTFQCASEFVREKEGFRILRRERNRGKGYSVKEGVLAAKGKRILFSDADLSTPIEELEKFLPWVDKGFDIVIGSRALPESDIQVHQARWRELMGKIFNVFVRFLAIKGIRDTQCGFKLFRREAAFDVFPRIRIDEFSFDVEVLFLCRRLGYSIQQVPVIWRNSPQSKVRVFRSSLKMLWDLARIRRLHRSLTGGKDEQQ
jgi:dolichyl-phosphate beta-glucosyltransferase